MDEKEKRTTMNLALTQVAEAEAAATAAYERRLNERITKLEAAVFLITAPVDLVNFTNRDKAGQLGWIVHYLVQEDFPLVHLKALAKIISLFNECRESEAEIFQFAVNLYQKYAG